MQAYGQTEKKISYPVNIQIERASSSAPADKPAAQTQEDAIRSLYETASTQPAARKAPAKKQSAEKSDKKSTKTAAEKKAATKTTNKNSTNKKAVATKPEQKTATKKVSEKKSTPAPTTAAKNTATANRKIEPPAPSASESNTANLSTTVSKSTTSPLTQPIQTVAPLVSGLAATELVSDDEDGPDAGVTPEGSVPESTLANALTDAAAVIEGVSPESESLPVKPAAIDPAAGVPEAPPVVAAVKNIPLPFSNEREAYITEFKNYHQKMGPFFTSLFQKSEQ